jgi:hypothetical protein
MLITVRYRSRSALMNFPSGQRLCYKPRGFSMREVFCNQDHARAGLYKSILDEVKIPTFVRNYCGHNTTNAPSSIFYPALCVMNGEDYDEAMRILGEVYYDTPSSREDWKCAQCGEEVPGTFDSCWKCNSLHADLGVAEEDSGKA